MLSLLKIIPLRTYLYAGLLAMTLVSGWKAYNVIWTAGYNSAQVELQSDRDKIANEAVAKARREWEAAVVAGETALIIEEKITRNLRDVEKRIQSAIESVDGACRNLGDAVLGVFNDAIDAANNRTADTAAAP